MSRTARASAWAPCTGGIPASRPWPRRFSWISLTRSRIWPSRPWLTPIHGSAGRFLEDATGLVSADRGLRQILMSATYATERIDRARGRLQQVGTRLVERAQRDGAVRADLQPTDVPLIEFMLASPPPTPGMSGPVSGAGTSR